ATTGPARPAAGPSDRESHRPARARGRQAACRAGGAARRARRLKRSRAHTALRKRCKLSVQQAVVRVRARKMLRAARHVVAAPLVAAAPDAVGAYVAARTH